MAKSKAKVEPIEEEDFIMEEEEEEVSSGPDWSAVLSELESKDSGEFFYLKEGRTRIKLVPESGNKTQFFVEAKRLWKGKEKTRYLAKAIVFADGSEPALKAVVIPKTVLKGIVGLLAEGYDLLDPHGHGLTILKSGSGLDTSYQVMPSPKPIKMPEGIGKLSASLAELATEMYERDKDKASKTKDEEEDEPKSKEKKNSKREDDWD